MNWDNARATLEKKKISRIAKSLYFSYSRSQDIQFLFTELN